MFELTKNKNLLLDNYLLLHIFDFLNPRDMYNLILSCKIFYNLLVDKINSIKVIYNLNIYCYDILKNISIIKDKHDNLCKKEKKTYIIDSYFKTKFYYHTFYLNRFPNKEIIIKIKDKLKKLNKEYELKRKFRIRYWNTINAGFNFNLLCFKKNFNLL